MVYYDQKPVILDPPVYFLSDAHLGTTDVADPKIQLERLFALLKLVQTKQAALVLVGDIFDFWFEWKTVIPKQYFELLHRLRSMTESGTPVHLLAGNHDFRVHGFLEDTVGIQTHQDGVQLQIADQLVFAFHGDGILANDHGYRILKKVLRSPVCQTLFSWIHPDIGMRLARGTSQTSRNATKGNPKEDDEYIAYARSKFQQGYSGVVMGHAHRPMQIDEGANTYVNLGDWIVHYTFALHDGSRLSLQNFDNYPELLKTEA